MEKKFKALNSEITKNKIYSCDIRDFKSNPQEAVYVNQDDDCKHHKKLSEQFEEKCKVLEMIKDQNSLIKELKEKINRLEEENINLQKDLNMKTDHNKVLESIRRGKDIDLKESIRRGKDIDLKESMVKYSTLEKTVKLKDGTNKNLSDQLMKYVKKDKENVHTIEKQKSIVRKLSNENESQKQELLTANLYVDNLKSELKSEQEKSANLEEKFTNLEKKSANLEEKSANLQEKSANLEKKSANLEEKSANLQEKSANLEEKSANLQEELKSKEAFLSELDAKIAKLYERQLLKEKEDEKYIQNIETELEQLKTGCEK